jgi:hypothetical protein
MLKSILEVSKSVAPEVPDKPNHFTWPTQLCIGHFLLVGQWLQEIPHHVVHVPVPDEDMKLLVELQQLLNRDGPQGTAGHARRLRILSLNLLLKLNNP